jgi:hypothetical protein
MTPRPRWTAPREWLDGGVRRVSESLAVSAPTTFDHIWEDGAGTHDSLFVHVDTWGSGIVRTWVGSAEISPHKLPTNTARIIIAHFRDRVDARLLFGFFDMDPDALYWFRMARDFAPDALTPEGRAKLLAVSCSADHKNNYDLKATQTAAQKVADKVLLGAAILGVGFVGGWKR